MATRRRRLGIAVSVAVAMSFVAGWWAAQEFQSPAQREASAKPPKPGPVFADVASGTLAAQVSGSGTVTYQRVEQLAVPTGASGVVTRRPAAGRQLVRSGSAVSEVDGRPVFVLSGRFDFYRDLAAGAAGADVTQLQGALRQAGYRIPRSEAGHYGPATASAVASMHRKAGYPASPRLPLAEVAVAPALPAVVDRVAAIGTHLVAGGTLAALAQGAVVVRVSVDAGAYVRVSAGMAASVTVESAPQPLTGRVTTLIPKGPGGMPSLTISLAKSPGPTAIGRSAVAVITTRLVAGRALLVPTRAIAVDAGGRARVLVEDRPTGERRAVSVRVLGSLNGQSAIAPEGGRQLHAGDLVQVG
jgi:peptidoglycan hydrolase-like protein with peptidoglycan-binding domain